MTTYQPQQKGTKIYSVSEPPPNLSQISHPLAFEHVYGADHTEDEEACGKSPQHEEKAETRVRLPVPLVWKRDRDKYRDTEIQRQ